MNDTDLKILRLHDIPHKILKLENNFKVVDYFQNLSEISDEIKKL